MEFVTLQDIKLPAKGDAIVSFTVKDKSKHLSIKAVTRRKLDVDDKDRVIFAKDNGKLYIGKVPMDIPGSILLGKNGNARMKETKDIVALESTCLAIGVTETCKYLVTDTIIATTINGVVVKMYEIVENNA